MSGLVHRTAGSPLRGAEPGHRQDRRDRTPRPADRLAGLAFDRTGTLWLELNGPTGKEAIGRVGAGNKVTLYDVPTREATLHRMILGPDGNMWFTELTADKVGYITAH